MKVPMTKQKKARLKMRVWTLFMECMEEMDGKGLRVLCGILEGLLLSLRLEKSKSP